jgi:CcmD family protein
VTVEEKYVAAAYLVVFVAVLVYLLIISTKLARLEREVTGIVERIRARQEPDVAEPESERVGQEVGQSHG